MRPEWLRDRITIQCLVTGEDEYGQPLNTWQDMVTVRARVEDIAGREYFAAQQIATVQVSTRITIRWRADVKPEMRVVHRNRIFDIKAVLDPDGHRRDLQLMCQEVIP